MSDGLPNSFQYEHCDVPAGVSLADWNRRTVRPEHRRAQLTGGFLAAVATLAPIVASRSERAILADLQDAQPRTRRRSAPAGQGELPV